MASCLLHPNKYQLFGWKEETKTSFHLLTLDSINFLSVLHACNFQDQFSGRNCYIIWKKKTFQYVWERYWLYNMILHIIQQHFSLDLLLYSKDEYWSRKRVVQPKRKRQQASQMSVNAQIWMFQFFRRSCMLKICTPFKIQ